MKQNGHFIVSLFIQTPFIKQVPETANCLKIIRLFSGIFDGWLAKVKSLVPIDDCHLIVCIYHN
ncbi:hypothetical protein EIX35_23720 [Escherichia coli]|nr:hypothetical protein [Escherichia coli]EFN7143051.1 hypothetical protein [Escherichia coli]EFN7157677.1 hypothetical protein [Escherichia coli]EFN7162854.1 hypothetical protein [Escherichia coli]HBX6156280.1 hypothetical protein [Klebsiella pneumoniae]